MLDKLLDILPLIKTFPKNTKIAVGFLFISVGIRLILYHYYLFWVRGVFHPFEIIGLFFSLVIIIPLILLPLCFLLMKRKWAWWTAVIWLGILVFIYAFISLQALFSVTPIDEVLTIFIYTLLLWSSFLLLILDKKNFEKIIIEEKEKITFIKVLLHMVLFSMSLMFLTAVCLIIILFIIFFFSGP